MAAYIIIGEEKKRLQKVSYGFVQNTSYETGYPNSSVRGGGISIQIKSGKDTIFYEWAKADNMTKDGSIEITSGPNNNTPIKTIQFTKAFIVSYQEIAGEGDSMEFLELSCKTIKIGESDEYVNKEWGEEEENR